MKKSITDRNSRKTAGASPVERAEQKTFKAKEKTKKVAQTLKKTSQEIEAILDKPVGFEDELIPIETEESKYEVQDKVALSYSEQQKENKSQKLVEKDKKLLGRDAWLARNGHTLTYAGIFLFTLILYFRPYELFTVLSRFNSMALVVAVATLLVYLPTQLSSEGNLTAMTTEVKCILFLAVSALVTIPIAKDPALAWETYSDVFIKIVVIFIIMVNTLRTKLRLQGLMWLAIGVGVMLSYQALGLYQKGDFRTDGYRVSVDFGGMFGNPNDMATHLVIFTPIAVALGVASHHKIAKLAYFACAVMMVAGTMVTQSRGGFLGLMAAAAVLAWKLGRNQRLKAALIAVTLTVLLMVFAPGDYGVRVMSIFVPSLDPVGSSDQRREALQRSVLVTLRNPMGIGFGNSPIVGVRDHETHNAYTQVSSELGWLAIAAYMILLISPFRKLSAIERQLPAHGEFRWIYLLSIGVQASIAGYMASSFFASVAYQWYVYYPIAFAIGLRRIYQLGQDETAAATGNATAGELATQQA